MMRATTRTIGSDLPSPEPALLRGSPGPTPWPADALLLQSGTQALTLIAASLAGRGCRSIAVPAFVCTSMVLPFAERGWTIRPYPVDAALRPRLEVAAALVADGGADAVLAVRYFGAQPDADDQRAARWIRGEGGYLIADETHHPLAPRRLAADVWFASLRKVLPVAAGAYVLGLAPQAEIEQGDDLGRWEAMDALASAEVPVDARARTAAANALLESAHEPRTVDARSRDALRALDYDELAARRRANAATLLGALGDCAGIRAAIAHGARDVPSHLPVRVDDPVGLQRRLARRGIYCPIHWPRPAALGEVPWPDDLLSLPVDHRYDETDMLRLARALREEAAA